MLVISYVLINPAASTVHGSFQSPSACWLLFAIYQRAAVWAEEIKKITAQCPPVCPHDPTRSTSGIGHADRKLPWQNCVQNWCFGLDPVRRHSLGCSWFKHRVDERASMVQKLRVFFVENGGNRSSFGNFAKIIPSVLLRGLLEKPT